MIVPSRGVSSRMGSALEASRRAVSNVKLLEVGVVGTTHITPPTSNTVAMMAAQTRMSSLTKRSNQDSPAMVHFFNVFSIFAHVSRSVTVRLNTRASGLESGSTQK